VSALRLRYEQRNERLTALRQVQNVLVSLAGLIGRPVQDQNEAELGRLPMLLPGGTGGRRTHR